MSHNRQHNRSISAALLAVMILSVLQFCVMPLAQAGSFSELTSDNSVHVSVDNEMADMDNHDCCLDDFSTSSVEMEASCPECEDIDSALKVSAPDTSEPLFALLYIVVQEAISQSLKIHNWRSFTEPNIVASRPDIYLANATFLE